MTEPDEEPDDSDGSPSIEPRELYDLLREDGAVSVLDLRDRDELEAWAIEGASVSHLPYSRAVQARVTGDLPDAAGDLDEPVVAVCAEGEASEEVAGFLREAGVEAVNLADGMEGWASVYVARTLDAGGDGTTVVQYDRPSSGCLSYLVHDGAVGAVVDPLRAFAERYVADAEAAGVELRYAVDTHVHADHASGVRAVADLAGAEPVLPAGARDRGLAFDATLVGDGDELAVGGVSLEAVHAPGHTTEMTAFLVDAADDVADDWTADGADSGPADGTSVDEPDDGGPDVPPTLLTGDSLFLDGVARPDLEDPSEAERYAARLYETLQAFLAFPDGSLVAPGHREPDADPREDGAYAATIADLRERVDELGLDRDAFVERVTERTPPRPANHGRLIRTNLGLEEVDEETAFELELGPNNCAAAAD